jgi:hypothetical protein
MATWRRAEQPTAIAPDGAEIRELVDRPQGATRLKLAEARPRQMPVTWRKRVSRRRCMRNCCGSSGLMR